MWRKIKDLIREHEKLGYYDTQQQQQQQQQQQHDDVCAGVGASASVGAGSSASVGAGSSAGSSVCVCCVNLSYWVAPSSRSSLLTSSRSGLLSLLDALRGTNSTHSTNESSSRKMILSDVTATFRPNCVTAVMVPHFFIMTCVYGDV